MHMMNQKENLYESKPMIQAVIIRSGKAMMAKVMGLKPTKLQQWNEHEIKLADIYPSFKKKIISCCS